MPAHCTKLAADAVLNSVSLARSSVTSAGTTSQPSRQPVIDQFLEKLLMPMTRSSGSAIESTEGARSRSKVMRS
jgi:hypothetical protein